MKSNMHYCKSCKVNYKCLSENAYGKENYLRINVARISEAFNTRSMQISLILKVIYITKQRWNSYALHTLPNLFQIKSTKMIHTYLPAR